MTILLKMLAYRSNGKIIQDNIILCLARDSLHCGPMWPLFHCSDSLYHDTECPCECAHVHDRIMRLERDNAEMKKRFCSAQADIERLENENLKFQADAKIVSRNIQE